MASAMSESTALLSNPDIIIFLRKTLGIIQNLGHSVSEINHYLASRQYWQNSTLISRNYVINSRVSSGGEPKDGGVVKCVA